MPGQGLSARSTRDLVVLALPGVQRFIAEARSTSDVRASSEVFAKLAHQAARVLGDQGGALVFPSGSVAEDGMPNRVVAALPSGRGVTAAQAARRALDDAWHGWVRRALGLTPGGQTPPTPGFPLVQWVCVDNALGGYPEQWRAAHLLLAARRRVRDFAAVEWPQRQLCSLAPRWPAEPAPEGIPEHERATLSAASWVKRRWRHINGGEGFPSTASVASAPYRQAVLAHLADREVREVVRELKRAAQQVVDASPGAGGYETRLPGLPDPGSDPGSWLASHGGPWVYPDRWQPDSLAGEAAAAEVIRQGAGAGRAAAARLGKLMAERGAPPLASYLAVVVQDVDSMGRFLSGEAANAAGERLAVSIATHQEVSANLQSLAGQQRQTLRGEDLLGVPVYAGGDDLLAFTPARTALAAAQACHGKVPASLPTASTAVLYFHYHASLQGALTRARALLEQAKSQVRGKHALAVGYLRRSGTGEASIQPWAARDGSSAEAFGIFARDVTHRLSPRLVADLDRDAGELARLSATDPRIYQAELARLVARHARAGAASREAAAKAAKALAWLGMNEAAQRPAPGSPAQRPQLAARVGVFLRQEAR